MKKRFTEEQIIGFLREAGAGMPVRELCRKHGFSKRALVPQPAARTRRDRALAAGIQRGAAKEGAGRADTCCLCEQLK